YRNGIPPLVHLRTRWPDAGRALGYMDALPVDGRCPGGPREGQRASDDPQRSSGEARDRDQQRESRRLAREQLCIRPEGDSGRRRRIEPWISWAVLGPGNRALV